MNLESFDTITRSKAGIVVKLRDPRNGQEVDGWFRVYGPDSDVYREAERRVLRMRNDRLKGSEDELLTFTEDEKLELVAPCVAEFGDLEENGTKLHFSQAEARRLLAKYPVILRQLDNKIGDARNFLSQIEGNSEPGPSGDSE